MKAYIINIGDELLIGQIVNLNASWMAEQLNLVGVEVCKIIVVGDKEEDIKNALYVATMEADLIFLTGGLGPTNDDKTKDVLCEYFNTNLVIHEPSLKMITELFKARGWGLTELNRKQAEVPEICKVILNKQGTAPGLWFEQNEKIFIATPGVPFEMKAMMLEHILPAIEKLLKAPWVVHKTIHTQGVGESFLAEKIASWENGIPSHISLAYLPSPGLVKLRLSARGNDKMQLRKDINEQIKKLLEIIPDFIFGYDSDTIESVVGNILKEKNKTMSAAESCTGGAIAQRITSIAGSSAYFKGSVVAYSNEVKENILGVNPATLLKFGAVSEETVKEMAANARAKLKTDYSVAVSGIAGPDGGTPEKPVGTVWIAVASEKNIIAKKFQFGNNRLVNIERAGVTALSMLMKCIS
ncbi:MAG TPA: competence/damage-inducible protein A [Bacteroidales bacterium]|nr:competence/damage-inducible protein A [Bacteroidales bacterium]HPS17236.1 competence/damage-inducible protein A [Bacteroidales bacterium]